VKIGRLIQIDNASVQQYEYSLNVGQQAQNERIRQQAKLQDDGFYYVMLAEHDGDTWGNDWYTETICLAADVTVLPDSFRDKAAVPPDNVIKRFG
ncbi:MAG: phage protein, partial [Cupriavidus necator]